MRKSLFYILAATMLLDFAACKKADPVLRRGDSRIADFYVTIAGLTDQKLATGRYSASGDTIYLDVPYYYPLNSDNEVSLSKLLLKASIPTDAIITPSLEKETDLTNPLDITVTAGDGTVSKYVLVAKKVGDFSITVARINFTADGASQEIEGVVQDNKVLFYVLPGTDVSDVTFSYEINKRSTGSPASGSDIDLSQLRPFTITGVDGQTKTYQLIATEPVKLDYGAGIHRKLFTKTAGELGFTTDGETSLAISGDYLVISTNGTPSRYRVFNRFTGAYVKDMPVPFSGMSMQLVNDDAGHILATSYTGVGSTFYVYRYNSVDDVNPVKLIEWQNTTPTTDASWIGAVGRAVNIYGNLDQNAVITATGAYTNIFQRWVVQNGALVSNTPTQVVYTGTDNMGVWAEVQPVSTNATGEYFVSYQSEVALVNGVSNARSNALTFGWPVVYTRPVAYGRFNKANYLAVVKYVNTYDLNQVQMAVYDVTQSSRLSMSPSDPDYSSFNIYNSDVFTTSGGAGGTTGDIGIGFSDGGERMQVYMLLTNGGIMAREFTNYAP